MRVVVLGGAGDMGAETVRDLVQHSPFDEIVIADRNVVGAEKLASELKDHRLKVTKIDATKHAELLKLLEGQPIVAGALGPFYRFERPIVEAVLEAGASYVSICDDHDAVESVLTLDQQAREKGCRILTGMGWTPGLSNLLARKGYEELDQVRSIRIYWAGSSGDSEGLAVILHTLHIFTGKVVSFKDGRMIRIKAGSEKETVEFPEPLGKVNTYHVGHPEPITVPLYLEGLQEVTLKGGLAENYLNGLTRFIAAIGLSRNRITRQMLGRMFKVLLPFFPTDKQRTLTAIRVDVSGHLNDQATTISYSALDHMKRLTGLPLSIGAIMMAENKIERRGVYGPEADHAVDPTMFLDELKKRNIEVLRQEFKH